MVLSFGGLLAAVMQFDFPFSDGWQMAASRAATHWPHAEATFRRHRAHYSVSLIDDAKTGFLKTDVPPNVKNGALPHFQQPRQILFNLARVRASSAMNGSW
jgi:hypothetical protein